MPELPEVETVRRGLSPALEGRKIARLEMRRPDLRFPFPEQFVARLTGHRIERLERRSKYLLARLSSGETLLVHLGMSGRFTIEAEAITDKPGQFAHAKATNPKHDHVVFHMQGDVQVTYNDPRRFGFMDLFATQEEASNRFLKVLGPEPNTNAFSAAYMAEALQGRRTPIKSALLDQSIVAGLGNIYVCEALWRSKISPKRQASSIQGAQAVSLASSVRQVIDEAIEAGGSSLKDFASADGELGYFQHQFDVYGREGEACHREGCKGLIFRVIQAGRSSFYCPTCQQ